MISIIIPFKDKSKLLGQCVFSVLEKTIYQDYEILLVNNQSSEDRTTLFLDEIIKNNRVSVLSYDKPFNFSAINNFAVNNCNSEYVLFLNNDTEVISPNWLDEMLKCFNDKKIGVVGAKLLYPNNTIQHCGVVLDKKNLAIHEFRTMKETDVVLEDRKEWPAVTGACMLTKRDLFIKAGGFDEINLPIAYNDVDYCLKISELGYKVVCVSNIKLYHYESASRKSDIWAKVFNRKRYKEFIKERSYIKNRWIN